MKRIIKLLALAAMLAVFAVPTLAQKQECTDDNKGTWYKTFYDNYKGDAAQQKVAYDNAKLYLDSCPADPNDKQAAFMKKFVDAVDEQRRRAKLAKDFDDAVVNKKYADQMRLGKEVLAFDPDNVDINTILGIAGLADASLLNESAQYARKAIPLIESGKPIKSYQKDQALAYLNWTIGKSQITSAPADAITSLLKAANINSDVKKSPQLYVDLNTAYENGPRAKLSEEYKSKTPNGTETPESKVVLENLNQVIDRQIDALARATALASNPTDKKAAMDELTALYKFRNKSENGVNELVAGVLSKPIPEPPTPITSLPTPTPAATPATPGANGAGNGSTTGGTKPAGNNLTTGNATNGGNKAGTASTTGTSTPASGKRPRLNHRRG